MSRAEQNRKRALWFASCSATHRIWCNCGNWMSHVEERTQAKRKCGILEGVSPAEGISFVTEEDPADLDTATGQEDGDVGTIIKDIHEYIKRY